MINKTVECLLDECQRDLCSAKTIIDSLGIMSNIVPYITKYSIIKSCGTIELSFKSLIADYCEKRAKRQIKKFISVRLRENANNPSYSNICRTLLQFDEVWNCNFKDSIDRRSDKSILLSSLQSLVDARNDFAHGGSPTLSINNVIDYFNNSRIVLEELDKVIV